MAFNLLLRENFFVPGPGENFSLKATTKDLPEDYSQSQIFIVLLFRIVFYSGALNVIENYI